MSSAEKIAATQIVVVMGVAGAGKSTVGRALAEAIGARFLDADDLHPASNVEKMRRGEPLDDADRAPWLSRVRAQIDRAVEQRASLVVACSALKEAYRRTITPENKAISFVMLDVPADVLRARLGARHGHFFDPRLLDSQLATLERPVDAVVVDAARPLEELVSAIVDALHG